MRQRMPRAVKIAMFAVMAIAVLFLLGFVVQGLWNWLMPPIFGLKVIGYWQSLGLILLGKLLFGGFSGGRGGHHRGGRMGDRWEQRMRERWEQMTPEEREQFRQRFQGWSTSASAESKPCA